jgi:DNA modification methylase
LKSKNRKSKNLSEDLSLTKNDVEPVHVDLSFSEKQLRQYKRTKHVHGLHPYLGKFIPQLAEYFLAWYFQKGDLVVDPFVGSGTTLVEANIRDINSIGVDISEFNCLLSKVKTQEFDMALLSKELTDSISRLIEFTKQKPSEYIPPTQIYEPIPESFSKWFSRKSIAELLYFREIIDDYTYSDALRILLSRCARSARQIFHFELDHPKGAVKEPYYCFKHRRICTPCMQALPFFKRYAKDMTKRIGQFQKLRGDASVDIAHEDSRTYDFPDNISGVFTSPPYLGLIDYHEQHSYAFDLLGLTDKSEKEIGSKSMGRNDTSKNLYIQGITDVLLNLREKLAENAHVFIVVNDTHDLYKDIAKQAEMKIIQRITRKVDRRTGLRGKAYSEEILHLRS